MKNNISAMLLVIVMGLIVIGGCGEKPPFSPLITDIKDSDHFRSETCDSLGVVAVFFYLPSCPTTRRMVPMLDDIADKYKESIKFVRVNCQKNKDLMIEFKINAVPRFMFFQNGSKVSDLIRARDEKHLYKLFEEYNQKLN